MQPPSIDAAIDQITTLFTQRGDDQYHGEPVTQHEHALQCAQLAEQAGAEAETVIAAYLHDIGHLLVSDDATDHMDGYGRIDHERLGANFLRNLGFSERVAILIENHVNAKRYLVAKNPTYGQNLSEASQQTLAFQGGPMTPAECMEFEQYPDFTTILRLRTWDERAKLTNHISPDPARYIALCRTHLARPARGRSSKPYILTE
ncbi:MAG: HD domain-containing protein [Cytophagales bacterium]|nr:MAG: HD domain-containing protein [Cytophagales bacterium]